MNTITQFTQNVLNFVSQELKNNLLYSLNSNSFSLSITEKVDFNGVLEDFMLASNHMYLTTFKLLLESFDLAYFNSEERKRYYYSKGKFSRTILTKYGEITFKRYSYQLKSGGNHFYYIDTKFGIDKYNRLDSNLKNYLYYLVAQSASYASVGKQLGQIIFRDSNTKGIFKSISRATVFNYVKRHPIQTTLYPSKHIKATQLYIEADEHYVSLQEKQMPDKKMVKCVKIYTDIKNGQYENRMILFEDKDSFWNKVVNTIESNYDLDSIQSIFILGDGAPWIKNGVNEFGRDKAKYIVDRFHYFQALHHLFTRQHKDLYDIAKTYILANQRHDFKQLVKTFLESNQSRVKMISDKSAYILNNWASFQKSLKYKTSCAMESCISHSIASICTSRPKGFKLNTLLKRLNLRELYLNSYGDEALFNKLLNQNRKEKEASDYISLWTHFDKMIPDLTYKLNLRNF